MIRNRYHSYRVLPAIILALIFISFLSVLPVRGQAVLGARSVGLGQATSALPNSEWSVFENISMMDEQNAHVSFFGIQYYGLSELTDIAAVGTVPTSIGIIGAGAHRFGYDLFNETRIRIAYKNSYDNFHYGAAINYNHVAIAEGYGSVGAVGIDLGIAARITKNVWIGAKTTNINQPKYGSINDIDEDLPRNLSIGFSYRLSGIALLTTDVVKEVNFPLSYRGGIEVEVIKNLRARAGITTAPQTFSGGFGYNTAKWGVNIVVQRHETKALGYSPGLDLNILW